MASIIDKKKKAEQEEKEEEVRAAFAQDTAASTRNASKVGVNNSSLRKSVLLPTASQSTASAEPAESVEEVKKSFSEYAKKKAVDVEAKNPYLASTHTVTRNNDGTVTRAESAPVETTEYYNALLKQARYNVDQQNKLADQIKKNGSNVTWNQAAGRAGNSILQNIIGAVGGTTSSAAQGAKDWARRNNIQVTSPAEQAKTAALNYLQNSELGQQVSRLKEQNIQAEAAQNAYNDVVRDVTEKRAMNSPDFATYAKYDPNKGNDKDFDSVYEYINGSYRVGDSFSDMLNLATSQRVRSQTMGSGADPANFMTNEEKAVYNYLYNKEGKDSADRYYNLLLPQLKAKSSAKVAGAVGEYATSSPAAGAIATAAAVPYKLAGDIYATGQTIGGMVTGNPAVVQQNLYADIASGARDAISKKFVEEGHPVWNFLYQTGNSMLDSTARASVASLLGAGEISKQASLIPMEMGVYQDTYKKAIEEGKTREEASALGVIAGGAEWITEMIELDSLFDALKNPANKTRDAWADVLKQASVEGKEELASNLINTVGEIAVLGTGSEWMKKIAAYEKEGLSHEEAVRKAFIDKAVEAGLDYLGGFISGGAGPVSYQAIATGVQASVDAAAKRQTNNTAKANNRVDEAVSQAKETRSKVEGEVEAAQNMTAEEWEASRSNQSDEAKARRSAVRESGTKYGASEEMIRSLEAVTDITGKRILIADEAEISRMSGATAEEARKIPGFHKKSTDEIVIKSSLDTDTAIKETIGHELAHSIENTSEWSDLRDAALNYYNNLADARTRRQMNRDMAERNKGENTKDYDYDAEVTADFCGNVLLESTEDIENLVNAHHDIAQRIWNKLNEWLTKYTSDLDVRTKAILTSAREKYGRALAENARRAEPQRNALPAAQNQQTEQRQTLPTAEQTTQTTQAATDEEYNAEVEQVIDDLAANRINIDEFNSRIDALEEKHGYPVSMLNRGSKQQTAASAQTAPAAEELTATPEQNVPKTGVLPTQNQIDVANEQLSPYQRAKAELDQRMQNGEFADDPDAYVEEAQDLREEFGISEEEAAADDRRGYGLDGEENDIQFKVTRNDIEKVNDYIDSLPVDVQFKVESPVERTKDLIAVHNLEADSLEWTLDLGAFPAPSIAVVLDSMGHDMYGDYSVLFGRNTIDPEKNAKNKLYGGDAWTPTKNNAIVEYELDTNKKWKLEDKIRNLGKQVAGGIFQNNGVISSLESGDSISYSPRELADKLAENETVKAAYLASKGKTLEPVFMAKQWSRKFGNKYLQMYLKEVSPQKLAQINADLWEGKNIEDALGDEYDKIMRVIRQYYEDTYLPIMQKRAEKNGWSQEKLNNKLKERVDEEIISFFTIEEFVKNAWEYYEDNGKTTDEIDRLATSSALNERVKNEDVKDWIYDQIKGIYKGSGIYNGKDILTPSGNRRTFKQTHLEVTAENIVKAMANAGESSVGAWGGSVMTESLPRYSSIEQMKSDEGRLTKKKQSEYDEIINGIKNRINDVAERIGVLNGESGFIFNDAVSDIMSAAASGSRTITAIKKSFAEEDLEISESIASDILDIYRDAASVPTGYFEAKPMRAVGFDEVMSIIAPNSASADYLDELRNKGFDVVTYKAGDAEDRRKVLNDTAEAKDIKFKVTSDVTPEENERYMKAVRSGDIDTARRMVEETARRAGFDNAIPEQVTAYATRTTAPPKKTIKVYKVFTLADDGSPTALFVSGIDKLPQNVWLNAQDTWHFTADNGRQYVPSTQNPYTDGGKTGGQVNIPNDEVRQQLIERGFLPKGSKAKAVTALAYRPGWHAGDLPFFPQGGMKIEGSNYENVHRYNQAVFECEFDADTDYTYYTYNKDGEVVFHDRQTMPTSGYYKFATNPMANAQDIGSWFISGSLKINRALTEEECNRILTENGRPTQEWQQYQDSAEIRKLKKADGKDAVKEYEHTIGEFNLERLGYTGEQYDAARKTLAPITYDDDGNVIPLKDRFNPNKNDIRFKVTASDDYDNITLDSLDESEYNSLESDSRVLWGNEGKTFISGKNGIGFRYAIVPAESLIVSNDEYGDENPDYPAELQPRDRKRSSSQLDVAEMANDLNPELLEHSATAQNGAPIIRGDGVVIGGNGRVAAIQSAIRQGKAGEYFDYLSNKAAEFGIEGELPENPVLVRVAKGDNWTKMAQDLNKSTTTKYSSTEQALTDAEMLDDNILSLLYIDEDGDLNTPRNADFIAAFVNNVAADSDRNSLVDTDGYLSQEGLRRVQAAVFARAYGDTGLLARMSESTDDDMRNVTRALMGAASRAALYRRDAAEGNAYDLNVTDEILAGIEIFAEAKRQKIVVDDIAGQQSLEGQVYGDAARAVALFINANKRSGAKIRQFFTEIYNSVYDLGDPNQTGLDLFGGGTDNSNVTVNEIFRRAAQRLLDEAGYDLTGRPNIDLGFEVEDIGERQTLPRDVRKGKTESVNGNGNNTSGNVQVSDSGRSRTKAPPAGRILPTAADDTANSGRYIDRESNTFADVIREEAEKLGMVTPTPGAQMEIAEQPDTTAAERKAQHLEVTGAMKGRKAQLEGEAKGKKAVEQAKEKGKTIVSNAEDRAEVIVERSKEKGKTIVSNSKAKADRVTQNAQIGAKMYKRSTKHSADEEAKRIVADAKNAAKGILDNAKEVGKAYEALGRDRAKAAEKKAFESGTERAERQYSKMVRDFEARQKKLEDRKNEHIDLWNRVHNTVYKPIETASDAMDLYGALKLARKNYERSSARSALTDREKAYVGRLIRGEEAAERLFEVPDIRYLKVLSVATNMYNYSQLGRILSEYRSHLRAVKNAVAVQALGPNFTKMRDIPTGWFGQLQTPERMIEYITGDDYDTADLLKQLYLRPMVEADADEVRLKDEVRDRVRKMHLDSTVRKGNKNSEDYAVQYLGELESNLAELKDDTAEWEKKHNARLERLQGNGNTLLTAEQQERLKKEQNKKPPMRDGMTLEETAQAIEDFKRDNPNLDYNRIEGELIPQFREIYNALFEMMNEVRVANGYEPVDYRKGYFPHYRREDESPLIRFARSLGMDFDTKLLPTTIQGLTQEFKPGINWFGNALKRKGTETDYGVTEGIDRYIEGVSKVITRTTAIQNLRALANTIRRLSDDNWQKRIDQIYSDRTMSDDEKYDKIENEYRKQIHDEDAKGQKTQLGIFVTLLDEMTNTYAGKATYIDRGVRNLMQNRATRGIFKLLKPFTDLPRAMVTKYGGNTVSVNPGSWLTNFAPIFEAAAEVNPRYIVKALVNMRSEVMNSDEFRDASNFITARFGSDTLIQPEGKGKRIVNKLAQPMELIDSFTSYVVTRSRYEQNVANGLSSEAALAEADEFAGRLMADRAAGRLPLAMQHKNPIAKIFTQFQVENLNSLFHNTHDVMYNLKKRYKDDDAAEKAVKILAHYASFALKKMLLLWLVNELYESLVGRRFMPDPIDWANEFVGDVTGNQVPNLINTGVEQGLYNLTGGKLGHDTADDWKVKSDPKNALPNLGKNVAEEIPMVGSFIGGGRFPVQTVYKDIGKLPKGVNLLLDDDSTNTEEAIANIVKGLSGPLTYLILPGGGTEIKRIVQAAEQVAQGGSYDESGKLRYPLYTDNPIETVGNVGKIALFGATSTDAGQKWVDSGFNTLSKAATAAYQALVALDVPTRDAYSIVNKYRDVEKTEDETLAYERRQYIRGLDISGKAKTALYETLVLNQTSKAREVLDTLDIAGADMNEAVNLMFDIADINRQGYETENSKSQDIRDAISNSKLSGDDKLYVYENYSAGSDRERALLDKLSQIDDGGEIVDTMNAIKSATKTDDESQSSLQRKALLESNLSGEGKLAVYTDYMLTAASQKEIDCLNSVAGQCDNGELAKTAMALKESGKAVDDTQVLLDAKLPAGVKEILYNTLVSDSKDEKISSLKSAGLSFDEYLKVANKYSEIGGSDDKAAIQATDFSMWLDKQGYSDSKKDAIQDAFGYYNMSRAKATGYEKLTDSGMEPEAARKLADTLSNMGDAKDYQKAHVIASESGMTESEKLSALRYVYSESENSTYSKAYVANMYKVPLDSYFTVIEKCLEVDADPKYADVKSNQRVAAAINSFSGLTNKQKAAIWQCYNISWAAKNNPFDTSVGAYVKSLYYESDGKTRKETMPGGLSKSSSSSAQNEAIASGTLPTASQISGSNALSAALGGRR